MIKVTFSKQDIHQELHVLHYSSKWLPLTMSWLYDEIRFLPTDIHNHIVCKEIVNEDSFSLPNVSIQTEQLPAIIHRCNAQILHSHFANAGWTNLHSAGQAGIKHIVSCYGVDISRLPAIEPLWRARYQELFEHAEAILCEGEHMAKTIRDLGCPPEKVKVHRLGIDLGRIPFCPRVWSPGQKLRVLIAGTFTEKKGIPIALEALGLLRQKIKCLEITVIGDMHPDKLDSAAIKAEIISAILKNGLWECTRLLGYVPHETMLHEAFAHHLFVSPSLTARDGDTEGGAPVSIIEMAASGMPVASTKHCDIPDVLGATNRKYLSEEGKSKSLTDSMLNMLNLADWSTLLNENRQHIEKHFSAVEQGKRLAEIYRYIAEK